jgi:beta-xylosidase
MTNRDIAATIAAAALRDLRDDIRNWQSSTGPSRARYRGYVRHDIAALRRAERRKRDAFAAWMRDARAEAAFAPIEKAA